MGSSQSVNKTYLTQEQKVLFDNMNSNMAANRPAALLAKQSLVGSIKKNITQTQNKLKDPALQAAKRQQITKQLQVKKKNLQIVQKIGAQPASS